MLKIVVVLLLFCLLAGEAGAVKSLTLSGGSWNQSIGSSDLVAGPGSNLQGSYTSTMPARLTVSGCIDSSDGWRIEVRRVDGSWNSAVRLSGIRTSDGSGAGSISGGLSETEVAASDRPFFSGSGDRDDILVLLKLSGVSILIPPGLYGSSLVYTVVDVP